MRYQTTKYVKEESGGAVKISSHHITDAKKCRRTRLRLDTACQFAQRQIHAPEWKEDEQKRQGKQTYCITSIKTLVIY